MKTIFKNLISYIKLCYTPKSNTMLYISYISKLERNLVSYVTRKKLKYHTT